MGREPMVDLPIVRAERVERELRRLADIEAITELKARYVCLVDTQQWSRWVEECFTPDGRFESEGLVRCGRDDLLEMVTSTLTGGSTVHHVYEPEIVLTGPDAAIGVWAMEDIVRTAGERPRAFHGFGHYHESYRRTDRGWRISTTVLTRLWVDRIDGQPG
jgi:hypothetical protein